MISTFKEFCLAAGWKMESRRSQEQKQEVHEGEVKNNGRLGKYGSKEMESSGQMQCILGRQHQ